MLKFSAAKSVLILSCLALGACSSLPSTPFTDKLLRPQSEEPVVETLVSAANELGDKELEQIEAADQALLLGEEEIALEMEEQETTPLAESDSLPQPVVPTVPMTANRVVERAINDYLTNRRTLLATWIRRADTWFPMIEEIFAEENVPDELKYIALGESNLRPNARSHAGALGMWQFMAGTGRSAGLEINGWLDERLDPEKSTRAAARHLKKLYESYAGNWHLALAGYNCSYRCISRAVRSAGGSINNPPSFWEIYPYLPRETREFVPKFIAASLIVSNPELYGIRVETVSPPFTYDVVRLRGQTKLTELATLAGTDRASLRKLNPALKSNTLPDLEEGYELKIPPGSFQRFVENFRQLPEELKLPATEYPVSRGDTLGKIAHRFNTSVAELQAVNGLKGHIIFPDQKLVIPGTGSGTPLTMLSEEAVTVDYGLAKFRPIQLGEGFELVEVEDKQARTEKNSLPLMAVSLVKDAADESMMLATLYTVRRGDTLGELAEKFDVSIRDLRQWNNIRGSTIYIGQELTIHTVTHKSPAASPTVYRVRKGDNLGAIARRFGVTVSNLKRWNGLDSNLIFPGQSLQIN